MIQTFKVRDRIQLARRTGTCGACTGSPVIIKGITLKIG